MRHKKEAAPDSYGCFMIHCSTCFPPFLSQTKKNDLNMRRLASILLIDVEIVFYQKAKGQSEH